MPARALHDLCLRLYETRSADILAARRADYMQGSRISFRSKEDAIHFAEKQGVHMLCGSTRLSRLC